MSQTNRGPFCGNCGAPVSDDDLFCGASGARRHDAEDSPPGATGDTQLEDRATLLAGQGVFGGPPGQVPPAGPSGYGGPGAPPAGPSGYGGSGATPAGPPGYGGYGSPAPAQSTPGRGSRILLGVLSALLVVGAVFGVTRLVTAQNETQAQEGAATPTATSSATGTTGPATPTPATPAPQPAQPTTTPPAEPVSSRYTLHRQSYGSFGPFSQVATLTDTTSEPFMQAVASAYGASGAGGQSVVLTDVYSQTTGKYYRVTCEAQPAGEVICSGGRNARIVLFN